MERFDAPWDRALTISTWLVVALLLALSLGLPVVGWLTVAAGGRPILPLLLIPLPLLGGLFLAWGLAPRGFTLSDGALVVERPLWPVRLPLASVRSVALLPSLPRGTIRLLGTGGLFGHYGRFWSPELGHYRLYATRSAGLVVVETSGGRFVLSPAPPQAFLEALRRAAAPN